MSLCRWEKQRQLMPSEAKNVDHFESIMVYYFRRRVQPEWAVSSTIWRPDWPPGCRRWRWSIDQQSTWSMKENRPGSYDKITVFNGVLVCSHAARALAVHAALRHTELDVGLNRRRVTQSKDNGPNSAPAFSPELFWTQCSAVYVCLGCQLICPSKSMWMGTNH